MILFSSSGKRGKKQRAGIVDISEIVSRIAPKVSNTAGGILKTFQFLDLLSKNAEHRLW